MICVSLADLPFETCVEALKDIEMAELRLDLLDFSLDQVQEIFSLKQKFLGVQNPFYKKGSGRRRHELIATHRPTTISEEERKEILITAIEAGADYVDVEIEADASFKKAILKTCGAKECKVILSFHNYENTPSKKELEDIIKHCFDDGADIAKIACRVNCEADAARILSLYDRENIKENQLVAIGMGEKGKITRLAAPLLGAPFTFAALTDAKKTAPGQLDVDTLKGLLDLIGAFGDQGGFFEKPPPWTPRKTFG